jgi:hypothetical protein
MFPFHRVAEGADQSLVPYPIPLRHKHCYRMLGERPPFSNQDKLHYFTEI